jgi:hypothetical protein
MSLGGEKHLDIRLRGVEARGQVGGGHLEGFGDGDGCRS